MNIRSQSIAVRSAAFTMVEIAICLAIIGLALVAIIGVLPLGMNIQRDNREETVINQDSTVFLESIRNGVRSGFDLTNYVYAITNYRTTYVKGAPIRTEVFGYGYTGASFNGTPTVYGITNNYRIIGLLSQPEYEDGLNPTNNVLDDGFSNHIYAYVHSLSGPAVEKPPQDNSILQADSFTYRILVVNAPLATDTNIFGLPDINANSSTYPLPPAAAGQPNNQQLYTHELAANLHELRMTFAWPILPSGAVRADAPLPQTQRTLIAGSLFATNDLNLQPLYFYQSQSFTNCP